MISGGASDLRAKAKRWDDKVRNYYQTEQIIRLSVCDRLWENWTFRAENGNLVLTRPVAHKKTKN